MFKRKKNLEFNDDNDLIAYDPNVEFDYDDIVEKPQVNPPPVQQFADKRRKAPEEFYVKSSDLIAEIKKYQQSKLEDSNMRNVPYEEGKGEISEELGIMIMKICTRFSLQPRFFGYTYRDEMVADAITRCLTNGVDKINPDHPKCNPFAYFTTIAFNCFRQKIKNEKKYNLTKQRLREEHYTEFEQNEGLEVTRDNEE